MVIQHRPIGKLGGGEPEKQVVTISGISAYPTSPVGWRETAWVADLTPTVDGTITVGGRDRKAVKGEKVDGGGVRRRTGAQIRLRHRHSHLDTPQITRLVVVASGHHHKVSRERREIHQPGTQRHRRSSLWCSGQNLHRGEHVGEQCCGSSRRRFRHNSSLDLPRATRAHRKPHEPSGCRLPQVVLTGGGC